MLDSQEVSAKFLNQFSNVITSASHNKLKVSKVGLCTESEYARYLIAFGSESLELS